MFVIIVTIVFLGREFCTGGVGGKSAKVGVLAAGRVCFCRFASGVGVRVLSRIRGVAFGQAKGERAGGMSVRRERGCCVCL